MFIQIIFEITTNHNRHCKWTQCQCTLEKKIKVLIFFLFLKKTSFFLLSLLQFFENEYRN